jgi:hypothetical protein
VTWFGGTASPGTVEQSGTWISPLPQLLPQEDEGGEGLPNANPGMMTIPVIKTASTTRQKRTFGGDDLAVRSRWQPSERVDFDVKNMAYLEPKVAKNDSAPPIGSQEFE